MYAITKLSSKTQLFITQLSSENKAKSLPVTIALARLIANSLSLPTSEVECIQSFYRLQHQIDVTGFVGELNELLFIDSEAVMSYILKFYTYRYDQTNPGNHLLLTNDNAVCDFFKITKSFSPLDLDCIKTNGGFIMEITNRFIDLLQELKGV